MKKLLLFFCFIFGLNAYGQVSPLTSFVAIPGQNDITVQWSISPGYSTNVSVEWSTDSFFFSTIYTYPGLCTENNSYAFVHTGASRDMKNFYRLNLGVYGITPVFGAMVGANKQNFLLYPNPLNEQATIVFQNPANFIVNLYLFDRNGQLLRKSPPLQGNTVQFSRDGLPAGLYYFAIATLNDLVVYGRFYVKDS